MTNQSIALLICILFIALVLSYYQYFYKIKRRSTTNNWLFVLRFFTYLGIGVLLFNPKINKTSTEIEKRNLVVLLDNSESISHLGDTVSVSNFIMDFKTNEGLKNKFNFNFFKFGTSVDLGDKLSYTDKQTNITQALNASNELFDLQKDVVILVSDGNQSLGADYNFWAQSKNFNIFPVVVGDTLAVLDTKIELVNANKYSFLNNTFPIELFVSSTNIDKQETQIQLFQNNQLIASKKVSFSEEKSTQQINFQIQAKQIGLQNFQLKLVPLADEKFTDNNSYQFGVEVIDESAKILVATSILHPDLAMLKRSIESNPQRKVDVKLVGEDPIVLDEYEMLIYYQPTENFSSLINRAKQKGLGNLLVTGEQTDYLFLNDQFEFYTKEITSVNENYYPIFNSDFSSYQAEKLNFESFPPLSNQFGNVSLKNPYQTLLYQKINGVETTAPLLLIYEGNNTKNAILQGENVWRWRSQSFVSNKNSFKNFDNFISQLVQYIGSNESKERLLVNTDNIIYEGETNLITAKFYDVNYTFQNDADLNIKLKRQNENQWQTYPMLYANNKFSFNTESLSPGKYDYNVFEAQTKISKSGEFNVIAYNIEKQFVSPDTKGLKNLSKNQSLFTLGESEKIQAELLNSKELEPIQKSITKKESLIDSLLLFIFLALTLSVEWFLRKYKGLI